MRLALGFSALALAAACLGWDYKFGFDSTKLFTAGAVALYTLLNGILTFWIFYVERGTIYEGISPSSSSSSSSSEEKEKIRISTRVDKNVPLYHVTVEITTMGGKKNKIEKVEITKSFTEWFDAAGRFVAVPFQTMLATGIPAVGRADPKRVAGAGAGSAAAAAGSGTKESAAGVAGTVYTPEMLDALAKSSSGAEVKSGKKAERRRKA